MKRKKGFTLIELLVVIGIIALLVSILMPALSRAKELAKRAVCQANQKGLGSATNIYMNENRGKAMRAWKQNGSGIAGFGTGGYNDAPGGAKGRWADSTWFEGSPFPDGKMQTAGNCLYLLVRYADVAPESFICPSSNDLAMNMQDAIAKGANEWTDCIDFDSGENLSYSYNDPWNRLLDDTSGSAYALMADKNPAYDTTNLAYNPKADIGPAPDDWQVANTAPEDWDWLLVRDKNFDLVRSGNTLNHNREITQAVFADGHVATGPNPCMGIGKDNIYTYYSATPLTQANITASSYIGRWQTNGKHTSHYIADTTPSAEDSFLGN